MALAPRGRHPGPPRAAPGLTPPGTRQRGARGPSGRRAGLGGEGAPRAPLKGPLMFANPGLSGGPAGLLAQQQAPERGARGAGGRCPRRPASDLAAPAWTPSGAARWTGRRCRGCRLVRAPVEESALPRGCWRWGTGGGTRRAGAGRGRERQGWDGLGPLGWRRFPGPGGALGLTSQTGRAPLERDPSAAPGPAPSASLGI